MKMPIYEFQCKECRKDFKTLRRADSVAEVACPDCGANHVMRMLSVTAQVPSVPQSSAACAMPAMSGCMGNPAACGCRLNAN